MLAPTAQLDRWRRMLAAAAPAVTPSPDALSQTLATTRGRPYLVAAVTTAVALQPGRDIAVIDLPPPRDLPVRRPAGEGASVADTVWTAYLRTLQSLPGAADWMRAFIDTLAPTALVFTADDNPEPWWQNEMVILHAVHSFALRLGDPRVLDRVLACADFHLREIQPDHATNEPWAVHAYASHSDGNVTAETLWHAAHIQHGGHPGPVATLLARDAAFSLKVWLERTAAT